MSKVHAFFGKFTVLKTAPRELWIIYAAKIMESIAYALMGMVLVLYLSADLGLGDMAAGSYYMVWSIIISVFTFMVGAMTDALGLKKSFMLGFSIVLVARLVMTVTNNFFLVTAFGFLPLALGFAMLFPIMTTAMKRFTSKDQRSIAFSIYYILMNFGFFFGNKGIDLIRATFGKHTIFTLPYINSQISTNNIIFFVAFLFSIPGFLMVIFLLRDGVEMTEEGIHIMPPKKDEGLTFMASAARVFKDAAKIFVEVWKDKSFHKFLLFLLFIVFVRMVFMHMNTATFPKYGDRLIEDFKMGSAWGLNMLIIVSLVPFIGALAQKIPSYTMMMIGTAVSAFAIFIMVIPLEIYAPLADTRFGDLIAWYLGINGKLHPLYVPIMIFIFFFSIGEAIWSPRLYEYVASLAPKGKEGSFMTLSILPMFAAKFFVGPFSGWLLKTYTPMQAKLDAAGNVIKDAAGKAVMIPGDMSNHQTIWLWIALMALVSPFGLILLRKFFRQQQGNH